MKKPAHLSLEYKLTIDVDISNLEINWPDVESWYASGDELFVTYKGKGANKGTTRKFFIDIHVDGEADWARPEAQRLFDSEWNRMPDFE